IESADVQGEEQETLRGLLERYSPYDAGLAEVAGQLGLIRNVLTANLDQGAQYRMDNLTALSDTAREAVLECIGEKWRTAYEQGLTGPKLDRLTGFGNDVWQAVLRRSAPTEDLMFHSPYRFSPKLY